MSSSGAPVAANLCDNCMTSSTPCPAVPACTHAHAHRCELQLMDTPTNALMSECMHAYICACTRAVMHVLFCSHMHGRCVCMHTRTYTLARMVCMGACRSVCHRHQLQLPSLEPHQMLCDLWQCWRPDHHSHMHELSWCTCGGQLVRQLHDEQHTLPSSPSLYACACASAPMRASTDGHAHNCTHVRVHACVHLRMHARCDACALLFTHAQTLRVYAHTHIHACSDGVHGSMQECVSQASATAAKPRTPPDALRPVAVLVSRRPLAHA